MTNRVTSVWMGDLDPYMDEVFIKTAFSTLGEAVISCIITHRMRDSGHMYGGSSGYCFVELADEASVDRCVQALNGKLIPGSNPPKKFKLNYASFKKRAEAGPDFELKPIFQVFVGNLSSEVDDCQLRDLFKKYPSCVEAKVIIGRGYGFVKFTDESEQKKAIEENQAVMLGRKPLRLSIAISKGLKTSSYQGGNQSYHSNYSQQQQQYYPAQPPGQSYYGQWGYDQYNSYNNTYNNSYNSSYNNGYNSSYSYPPAYTYPPPGHTMMPPPPIGMPPLPGTDMTGAAEKTPEAKRRRRSKQEFEEKEEKKKGEAVDPNPPLDVETMNKEYMERSEELYDAMMNCYWHKQLKWRRPKSERKDPSHHWT